MLTVLLFPVIAAFWVFVVWALWTIVQSFKSIAVSFQEIARSQQNRPLL